MKEIRKQQGLTQEDLGQALHLTRQTVSNWEQGKSLPSLQDVVTISDSYGISLDELIKEDQQMRNKIEEADRKEDRQDKVYALAYVINGLTLTVLILNHYLNFLPKVTGILNLVLVAAVIALYLAVKQPVVLYENKWSMLAILAAFLYFLSIGLTTTAGSIKSSFDMGHWLGEVTHVLILTSSAYFLPQVPEWLKKKM
ncbi:helix-turn-helix transcriptional regulator [Fructobacillus sp. M1-21]|uniref:Helix-turn-helix transcriptional regulator n=2 Tax=Fructobacillus papyrifericola TaxID=2713172 RepID=A0ABS5QU24_9LACO|nr:helix-turn-helix transcriptional regulator [Fructobacillus papyrifericola]